MVTMVAADRFPTSSSVTNANCVVPAWYETDRAQLVSGPKGRMRPPFRRSAVPPALVPLITCDATFVGLSGALTCGAGGAEVFNVTDTEALELNAARESNARTSSVFCPSINPTG